MHLQLDLHSFCLAWADWWLGRRLIHKPGYDQYIVWLPCNNCWCIYITPHRMKLKCLHMYSTLNMYIAAWYSNRNCVTLAMIQHSKHVVHLIDMDIFNDSIVVVVWQDLPSIINAPNKVSCRCVVANVVIVVVVCPALQNPQNGRVDYSNQKRTIGTTATYFCKSVFVTNGNAERQCQIDTTWSGSAPKCTSECSTNCLWC